jgi:hypothetical protein
MEHQQRRTPEVLPLAEDLPSAGGPGAEEVEEAPPVPVLSPDPEDTRVPAILALPQVPDKSAHGLHFQCIGPSAFWGQRAPTHTMRASRNWLATEFSLSRPQRTP